MLSVDQLEDKLIDLAFAEDIGDGDHTTLCCIPEDAMGKSHLLIKEEGILAGIEVAKKGFRPLRSYYAGRSSHRGRYTCQAGRHRNDSHRQDTVTFADRATDAEHYAAHERYSHNDQSLCPTARGYKDTSTRHPQDNSRTTYA